MSKCNFVVDEVSPNSGQTFKLFLKCDDEDGSVAVIARDTHSNSLLVIATIDTLRGVTIVDNMFGFWHRNEK